MAREPDGTMYEERLRELKFFQSQEKNVKRKPHYFNYQMGRRSIEKTEPCSFWRCSATEGATKKWQE